VQQLSLRWPGAAAGIVGFNEPLAHLLMAGADFLLVPSRQEPCGLVARCAQRYGTVPLVSPTGGLRPIAQGRAGLPLPQVRGARVACLTDRLTDLISNAQDKGDER